MHSLKDKIAAIVVTYNRKELLQKCLDGLLSQTRPLDSIIIIDNASTDGTEELLEDKGYLTNPIIDYVKMLTNTGGSGGFHEGVKRGYSKGYDWLWLMDDDVMPENNCLEVLLSNIDTIYKIKKMKPWVVVPTRSYLDQNKLSEPVVEKYNLNNPFHSLVQNTISENHINEEYFQIEGFAFEGPLINKECIARIGYPDKRFFIWGDDTDYCLRIRKAGGIIFYIPKAKLIRLRIPSNVNILTKEQLIILYRNAIYLNLKYGSIFVKILRPLFTVLKFISINVIKGQIKKVPNVFISLFFAYKRYFEEYNYFS
ncbi:MAG: glycosyltransferase [Parcubacteria group bacterium]|nr:glycosyltransferase [Parcubacteria group bacterium]